MTRGGDVDDLLRRRAAELASAQRIEQDEGLLELLVLSVGDQRVALPLNRIAEVRPPHLVAQVPGSTAVLVGLVGGRGEALPVVSLGAALGLAPTQPAHEQWVAVLHDPTGALGLLADAAEDIVRIPEDELTPTGDAGSLVTAIDPSGTLLLDPLALLHDSRSTLHSTDHTEEPAWHER